MSDEVNELCCSEQTAAELYAALGVRVVDGYLTLLRPGGALRVRVLAASEIEKQTDAVVCLLASIETTFPDNVITSCNDCGASIQHRPHVPKNLPKICEACAEVRLRAGNA